MIAELNALPSSEGAEKSIISCILQDPAEMLDRAIELGVDSKWFHSYPARRMWDVLSNRSNKGESLDLVLLTQSLIDSGDLERLGGPSGITEFWTYSTNSQNFNAHVSEVKHKFAARMVIDVANNAIGAAYDVSDKESVNNALKTLSEPVSEVFELIMGKSNRATSKQLMVNWVDAYRLRMKGEELLTLPCRMDGLERLYGGLITPAYMIVTALPSSGKTAFATQLMNGVCEGGHKAMCFSLEMSKEKLADRIIINESGVDGEKITKPHIFVPIKIDLKMIKDAANKIQDYDMVIHEEPAMHIDKICSLARSENRRGSLDFIAIDYAQLIKGERHKGDSKESEFADISHKLQALVKELNCTICVLSQTSFDAKGNVSTKYAKVFEDDADLWLHIIREKGAEDVEDVVVMKCRHHGHNGKMLNMQFTKNIQRFEAKPYLPTENE